MRDLGDQQHLLDGPRLQRAKLGTDLHEFPRLLEPKRHDLDETKTLRNVRYFARRSASSMRMRRSDGSLIFLKATTSRKPSTTFRSISLSRSSCSSLSPGLSGSSMLTVRAPEDKENGDF